MSDYKVVNPATGETVREYPTASDDEIRTAIERADRAFDAWRRTSVHEREDLLRMVADIYDKRREELAALITEEMGKPVKQAVPEVKLSADIYRYYADNGERFLQDDELDRTSAGRAVVRRVPIGVVLGIMPWNYPYYQVARFAGPNLLLGNTVLLKHASQCPESALAMEQIFSEAGAPEHVYTNLFASNKQVAQIIADPRLQGVSLTGSERAGAAVAEVAGRNLKKVVLELGGSDPFIVTGPVDLDRDTRHAVRGRMANAGQACNAAKRIIVTEPYYDEFVQRLTEAVKAITPNDPTDPDTLVGPLSSDAAVDGLAAQVDDAIDKGATVLAGGKRLDRAGAWYQPTVLADVTPQMRAFREELFGPVAVVYKVADDDEAVRLANDSSYGLGAVIQCDDEQKALGLAAQLETGMVVINEPPGSSPELPFGGVKRSGFGRELGRYGLDEFANKKLVQIAGETGTGVDR